MRSRSLDATAELLNVRVPRSPSKGRLLNREIMFEVVQAKLCLLGSSIESDRGPWSSPKREILLLSVFGGGSNRWPLIVGTMPGLVWVVPFHSLGNIQ